MFPSALANVCQKIEQKGKIRRLHIFSLEQSRQRQGDLYKSARIRWITIRLKLKQGIKCSNYNDGKLRDHIGRKKNSLISGTAST